jgi:uncharacterized membrane protein YphA (DoxX/SURF4 family)
MNVALWIAQLVLAGVFLLSGLMKSTQSRARMAETGQTGVANLPMPFIRFVGASEIAAALGLVAPRLAGVAPGVTPIAAIGLMVVMIPAAVIHYRLHEPKNVATNVTLFLLCVFVCWGRLAS